nr:ABC transporter substrate-binding protein [Mangrovicoccus algicola]
MGAAAAATVAGRVRAAAPGPRLAAIDWAMLETAAAIGAMPVAACELLRFREDAVEPALPGSVTDLGLRSAPNMELLQLVRPELILSSPWYAPMAPRFGTIAPVLSLPVYVPGESPWPHAIAALHALAERLDMPRAAEAAAAAAAHDLAGLAARLAPFRDRPVYVADIGDARHFRAFGADSMFGAILGELGLENAWTGGSRYAFAAPVPIERLAERPEARIVTVSGIPVLARRALETSVLWNRIPAVAEGRLLHLAPVNPFGGVPAGLRFARLLAAGLGA